MHSALLARLCQSLTSTVTQELQLHICAFMKGTKRRSTNTEKAVVRKRKKKTRRKQITTTIIMLQQLHLKSEKPAVAAEIIRKIMSEIHTFGLAE